MGAFITVPFLCLDSELKIALIMVCIEYKWWFLESVVLFGYICVFLAANLYGWVWFKVKSSLFYKINIRICSVLSEAVSVYCHTVLLISNAEIPFYKETKKFQVLIQHIIIKHLQRIFYKWLYFNNVLTNIFDTVIS